MAGEELNDIVFDTVVTTVENCGGRGAATRIRLRNRCGGRCAGR
jgi:hypothetical protein